MDAFRCWVCSALLAALCAALGVALGVLHGACARSQLSEPATTPAVPAPVFTAPARRATASVTEPPVTTVAPRTPDDRENPPPKCQGANTTPFSEQPTALVIGNTLVLLNRYTANFYIADSACRNRGMELARLDTHLLVGFFEDLHMPLWVAQGQEDMVYFADGGCEDLGAKQALVVYADGCKARNKADVLGFACSCEHE